ncbi:MAG: hypothetical protein GWP11_05510 [Proteobacteria bacterium]|nr:hypothetical protein [Pseudomonadota bacterium]
MNTGLSAPNGDPPERRNPWFAKRHDFFVRRAIDEFFRLTRSFEDIYLIYLECRSPLADPCADLLDRQTGEVRTRLWDRLTVMVGTENEKGPLWRLKDLCHLVWPKSDEPQGQGGSLVDWLVGAVFHEAMKLKENIYLLNSYGPAACKMRSCPAGPVRFCGPGPAPVPRLESMIDVRGLISRAAADVVGQMEQIAFLLTHTAFILRLMMPDLARNMLVVRLLVEREDVLRLLWGETLEAVFTDMFYGDAAEGFCTAGRSYLRGQWFPQALRMYQKALAVSPTCDEAITRLVQLQAIVRENRQLLGIT